MQMLASKRSCRYGQWTMISLLVTIAIILVLAGLYFPRIAEKHSKPGEARSPRERAYGAACGQYASEMNQAVFIYKTDHDDQPPRTFADLKKYGVTDEMLNADGCYFRMDARSGQVSDIGYGGYTGATPPEYTSTGAGAPAGGPDQNASPPPPPRVDRPGRLGPGGIRIPDMPVPVDPGN